MGLTSPTECSVSERYPTRCAHQLISEQAALSPKSPALVFRNQVIDFATLDLISNQLAQFLSSIGVKREARVGLCLRRSPQAIIGLIGILKAAAAYVPLDPSYPVERILFIVKDAGLSVVLADSDTSSLFFGTAIRIVKLADIENISTDAKEAESAASEMNADSAAYVCYTSGSTGTPKGIVHTHRHLVHRMPDIKADDVCVLNVSLSFGFSLARLFPPLFHGRPLVIIPDEEVHDLREFVEAIEREKITNIAGVPAIIRQLLGSGRNPQSRLSSVRSVTIAGATLDNDLIAACKNALPNARLLYGFGISETGPITLREITESVNPNSRDVGVPLANTQILILDKNMQLLTHGAVGEIYVASLHLAREYLNLPHLTTHHFVSNPFPTEWSGSRLFRTGDCGRWLPNGHLELKGRVDNQVKVRGYRIELEEIEFALQTHPEVQQAVIAPQEENGETRLVAYIVTPNPRKPGTGALRAYLAKSLPDYMLPALYICVDNLPLLSNGKVDRNMLPRFDHERPALDTPYQSPRNVTEEALVEIWCSTLQLGQVGIHDHFIDLGADSLIAVALSARILDQFNVEIPLLTLFEQPTIAELATILSNRPESN